MDAESRESRRLAREKARALDTSEGASSKTRDRSIAGFTRRTSCGTSTAVRRARSLPILSLLLFAALPARAGTFYIADIGARGLGRAGAYVAAPDSLLALHYNPAGLSLLSGFHMEADLSMNNLDFTFTRGCPCVDPAHKSLSGQPDAAMVDSQLASEFGKSPAHSQKALYNPFLSIGYGFQFMDLTIAFAAYGPNAGRYSYDRNLPSVRQDADRFAAAARLAPERYSALDVDTLEANFQLGAAMQPIKGFRLGGSVMMYQTANKQTLHLWANLPTLANGPEDATLDVPLIIDFKRNFALNWSIGAIVEPLPGLSIGASFRGKRSVRADGTATGINSNTLQLTDRLGGAATISGQRVEVELNTAPIARLGVQYAVPKLFKAEVATVFEGWSVYDRVVVRPLDIQITQIGQMPQPLARLVQPRNWNDTFSLRVGGELNVLEPLAGFRAGYFFEPSGIPTSYLDPSRVDLNKHGFALGVSTTFMGVSLEIAGMYVLMQTTRVTDSKVLINSLADRGDPGPIKPPPGSSPATVAQYGAELTTIGNGTYEAHYLIASASLSFALDPLLGL